MLSVNINNCGKLFFLFFVFVFFFGLFVTPVFLGVVSPLLHPCNSSGLTNISSLPQWEGCAHSIYYPPSLSQKHHFSCPQQMVRSVFFYLELEDMPLRSQGPKDMIWGLLVAFFPARWREVWDKETQWQKYRTSGWSNWASDRGGRRQWGGLEIREGRRSRSRECRSHKTTVYKFNQT